MFLVIDTSQDKVFIALGKRKILSQKVWQAQFRLSETLLPAIDQLLKKNKLGLVDLTGIIVVSGPGSYSGLRVGVACANALSFGLKIPVVGIKSSPPKRLFQIGVKKLKDKKFRIEALVVPFYGKKPTIS